MATLRRFNCYWKVTTIEFIALHSGFLAIKRTLRTSPKTCVSRCQKKLKSFAARARFSTWIYQVVINACRDQLRSQTSRQSLDEVYGEVSELKRAAEQDTKARISWLYSALDKLSPQLRETAVLVLAEDLTHSQAGEILKIKEKTVSWRMHEIRKRLKTLAESGDGELV